MGSALRPRLMSRPKRRSVGRPTVFGSFRRRMAISHGVVLAAIVLILGGLGYILLSHYLSAQATSDVRVAALEQVDRIQESGHAVAAPDEDLPSASAIRVAVFRPDGTALSEAGSSDVPSWLRPQVTAISTIDALGEPVRLITAQAHVQGRTIATVVAAQSLAPQDELLDRVRLLLLVGGALAVLASMVAGWFLAGRAMRPVDRAYQAQANFAADASHELRTPLAFVRSGVEVLADHEPQLGGDVLLELDYLTDLTARMLTLARADNGSMVLHGEPVHVAELCRRVLARNERVHGVQVSFEPSGDPVATADPVALEAVLDAIVENVARHGGGVATMRCMPVGDRVRVSIADCGVGLSTAQRDAAFERFFRADPSRGRLPGGAGLGLAIARELMRAQDGRIWLEETPGGGLTTLVELLADVTPAGRQPLRPCDWR